MTSSVTNTKEATLRWTVSARGLKDMDIAGKTDPYVKIYTQEGNAWKLIGETEKIRNVLDANWAFVFEDKKYVRNTNQYWKVEVWDHDHVGKDQLAGETIVSIDSYVRGNQIITSPLSTQGTIQLLKVN